MDDIIKKHFVFDFDDTLVDSSKFCSEVLVEVIQSSKPGLDPKLIHDFHYANRGLTIVDIYKLAVLEFDLSVDYRSLLEKDVALQMAALDKIDVFYGTEEILQYLKIKGKSLHICSNRTGATLQRILDHKNLSVYFDSVISCPDMGFGKPDPRSLNNLIQKHGGDKDEFIYFGDSEVDSIFAKNCKVDYLIFDHYLNDKNLFKNLIHLLLP